MPDAIDAHHFAFMINPIENPVISNPKLAEAGEVFGHPGQSAMHHPLGVFRKPNNLPFDTGSDGGIQFSQLAVSFWTYFDLVGHARWRGFQGLNLPAKSALRASRNSSMIRGFCDVSQSASSSRVSIDSRTWTGISTVSDRDFIAGEIIALNGGSQAGQMRPDK